MLSCLFIASLWSPAGKGLTSWLLFMMWCPGSGVVPECRLSIPDLCRLSYFCLLHRGQVGLSLRWADSLL